MAIGLNLYLGSQSICFVGFWVSYCGWSCAWQPEYTPVYSDLSLYLIELLSLRVIARDGNLDSTRGYPAQSDPNGPDFTRPDKE